MLKKKKEDVCCILSSIFSCFPWESQFALLAHHITRAPPYVSPPLLWGCKTARENHKIGLIGSITNLWFPVSVGPSFYCFATLLFIFIQLHCSFPTTAVSTHYYNPPTLYPLSFTYSIRSRLPTLLQKKNFRWEFPQLSFIPFLSILSILPLFPTSFLSLGRSGALSFLLSRSCAIYFE